MDVVWLLLCLLWLGVAANDAKRAHRNEPLLTANAPLRRALAGVDRRWTWAWLLLLCTIGLAGLAGSLGQLF